jgi:hypothetical protein
MRLIIGQCPAAARLAAAAHRRQRKGAGGP